MATAEDQLKNGALVWTFKSEVRSVANVAILLGLWFLVCSFFNMGGTDVLCIANATLAFICIIYSVLGNFKQTPGILLQGGYLTVFFAGLKIVCTIFFAAIAFEKIGWYVLTGLFDAGIGACFLIYGFHILGDANRFKKIFTEEIQNVIMPEVERMVKELRVLNPRTSPEVMESTGYHKKTIFSSNLRVKCKYIGDRIALLLTHISIGGSLLPEKFLVLNRNEIEFKLEQVCQPDSGHIGDLTIQDYHETDRLLKPTAYSVKRFDISAEAFDRFEMWKKQSLQRFSESEQLEETGTD